MPRQNSIRASFMVARISARSASERILPMLISALCTVITLYGLFSVYGRGIDAVGSIQGMTLAALLWSLAMYSIYWGIGTRYIFHDIAEDVKDGKIEVQLVKPMHYLGLKVCLRLGRQVPMVLQQLIVNIGFLLFYVGLPPLIITLPWIASVIGLFVLGSSISVMLFICIGLCAFWIDNPTPVMWIVDKMVMIIGGAFVPIVLFPDVIRHIAEWSPFGAMMAFSQAFTPDFLAHAPFLFLTQSVWIVIMSCFVALLWHMAQRRVSINGG